MTIIKAIIYIIIAIVMTSSLIAFDAFDALYEYTRAHEDWELDEIIIASVVAMITCIVVLSIELSKTKLEKSKKIEAELRHRFDALTQSVPLPVIIIRRDSGEIEYLNQPGARLLGYPTCEPEAFAGTRLIDDENAYRKILERLDQDGLVERHEIRFSPDCCTATTALLYCREIVVDGKASLVTVVVDLSEIFASQAQLVHASKLATLGEMSAGIAHELNQPLNNIRMAAEILGERDENGDLLPGADQLLENITSQVDRAATIIDHMRMFARNDVSEGEVDPIKAVDGALSLVGEQIRLAGINIVHLAPDTVRLVRGDTFQLEQVVVNLLTNARDAIIQHDDVNGKQPGHIRIEIEDNSESDTINIMISDDGGGIPENVKNQIFDPFFTTKEVGKGTGIGLSISHGIIASMGGTITTENTEDGARFIIALSAMTDGIDSQA